MVLLVSLLFAGLLSCLLGVGILVVSWFIYGVFFQSLFASTSYRQAIIEYAIWNLMATLVTAPFALVWLAFTSVLAVLTNIRLRFALLFVFSFLVLGCALWNVHHDGIVRVTFVFEQCYTRGIIDFFLLPLLNIVRLLYNFIMPFVDFYVDMVANFELTPVITLFKCATLSDLLNMFYYFGNIFYAFGHDFNNWIITDIFRGRFTILDTLDAIGLWVDAMIAPFDCWCRVIFFLPRMLAIWARLPSVHHAIDCAFNVFIRLIQIPIYTILFSPDFRPNFNATVEEACCALHSTGEAVEDTVFLIVQTAWGIFISPILPHEIALFFSTHWAKIFSGPLCSVVLLVNITLTSAVHYDGLIAADGSGIGYLQFGSIADELRDAAEGFGELFVLFNNDAQALVTTLLWTIIDFAAFILEWVLGNIWYFIFGGALPLYPSAPSGFPSNFLRYYLPDYQLKPEFDNLAANNSTYVYHTYIQRMFQDALMASQALGNLIGNLLEMDPLAGLIQHALNVIIGLFQVSFNLISFFYPIITFDADPRTTMRAINLNPVFNELYFLAGSAGDMFRQFQEPDPFTNLTCQISPNEGDKTFLCCMGNLVERAIDVIVVGLQQVVNFVVDLVTLPTGNVKFCVVFVPGPNYTYANLTDVPKCLRVPDLSLSLFLLDEALCDLSCIIFSVLPLLSQFECIFPQPPPPAPNEVPQQAKDCGHMSTCGGNLLCKILHIFTVPLHILNTVLKMFTQGTGFTGYTTFGAYIVGEFMGSLADALAAFGLLINCTLCAFLHIPNSSPNCDDSFYQLFLDFGLLLRKLAVIVSELGFLVVKLILSFVIGFLSGNPIGAVIDFIVGVLTDIFGGLGKVVVDFLVSFFNAIGLGFIGVFIKILWQGFCPLLQVMMNLIVIVLKALTLGLVPIKFVEFCCSGAPDCVPTGAKRMEDGTYQNSFSGLINGVQYLNVSNWLQFLTDHVAWDVNNPCNATMTQYKYADWNNLTDSQQGEAMYCIMRHYWPLRDDNQVDIGLSKCDRLIYGYNQTAWNNIALEGQAIIIDCMQDRLFVDAIRHGSGATWIPSDWLTNDRRKFMFAGQLIRGLAIYWQYKSDTEKASDVILSQTYRDSWAQMGLSVSHYDQMNSVDEILIFRDHYHLVDYFEWNNATQYEAVKAITIGTWSFINAMLDGLYNTSIALSDNTTDPSIYLTYGYTLDNNAAAASSAVFALLSHGLAGIKTMAAYWSDPVNVKKRSNAVDLVRRGSWAIYTQGVEQFKMVTGEYLKAKQHESEIIAGHCSTNETQTYMDNYHEAMLHDEHSLVFKISRWWDRKGPNLFKNYPISNPRDGQRRLRYNQSAFLFSYRDAQGIECQETGRQRLSRFYDVFWKGSPASNRRWNSLSNIWTVVKERVYGRILHHHFNDITAYMKRVYEKPSLIIPKGLRQPIALHAGFMRLDSNVMPESYMPVNRHFEAELYAQTLRTREQAIYCNGRISPDDGLCQGYEPIKNEIKLQKPLIRPKLATDTISARNVHGFHAIPDSIVRSDFLKHSLVFADGFLDITCRYPIPFGSSDMCTECTVLQLILDRVISGLENLVTWFTGPHFSASFDRAMNLFDYLFDESAYVVIGDSPSFPAGGWPRYYPEDEWWNFRPLGDDTPNKLRFFDFFNGTTSGNATDTLDLFMPVDDGSFNSWVIRFVVNCFFFLGGKVYTAIVTRGGNAADLVLQLTDLCLLCEWFTWYEFFGLGKRFSIAEALFIFFCIYVVFSIVFQVSIGFSLFTFFFATSTGLYVFIFFFLTFYASWSWLCWYGLPLILADDIMYSLTYTFLAKCPWVLASLISNPEYNNLNCYPCTNAYEWDFANCVYEVGFSDFFVHIVFTMELYWPWLLEWVRTSTFPLVSMIYRLPWIASRINQFVGLDLRNQVIGRQYLSCNFGWVSWSNFAIFTYGLIIISLFLPLVALVTTLLTTILSILTQIIFLVFYILMDLVESFLHMPYLMAGLSEGGEFEEDDGGGSAEVAVESLTMGAIMGEKKRRRVMRPPSFVYSEKQDRLTFSRLVNTFRRAYDNFFGDRKSK